MNCYQSYCIESPYLVMLIIPIFIVLLIVMFKNFVKFGSIEQADDFRKHKRFYRIIMLVTRTLILLFILVAIANPFTVEDVITHGDPVIKLLVDNTVSMDVMDPDLIQNVKEIFEGKIALEIDQISSGKKSMLADGILRSMDGNDNLLIISDGNNNYGKTLLDVGIYAGISDTRLFAVKTSPVKNDAYVRIDGPSETIEDTQNRFNVMVEYVGNQPAFTLQVFVDDALKYSGQNDYEEDIVVSLGPGYHKITAKIILEDHFSENNVFHKSVKSVPRPKVLFVSKRSNPIEEGLAEIYELTRKNRIEGDINDYHAVIFNDLHYNDLKGWEETLAGYLIEGGGVVFIGGRASFDKGAYKESLIESLLPVTVGAGKIIQPLKHNIVIVLDVSDSFGDFSYKAGGANTALDLGKANAVKMIEEFRDDISVGLVAFATLGQVLAYPQPLEDSRQSLINKIETLGTGEGTQLSIGLLHAQKALAGVKGTRNVVLISDGKMNRGSLGFDPGTMRKAQEMASQGVRIYTVGMPSLIDNQAAIDRNILREIAKIGNGNYYEPNEFQYLNVFFGKPEAKEKIFSGNSNLAVVDKNHFITDNIELNAMITGLNFVIPKLGARSLIVTGDGNPILNAWNFGLGRVVALATDDGSQWASSLLTKDNSILLTRMINYAVGNPERDKDIYIDARDGFMGENTEIFVKSDKFPVSSQLTFTKESESVYKAEFNPDDIGYYQFFDSVVAVNSEREYYNLGPNPKLEDMVELSGGKMISLDEDVLEDISSYTERTETKRKDLKLYPLAVVLTLFIIEIIIRKIYEHRGAK